MSVFWQNVLVLGMVIAAAIYVARRVRRWATSKKPTGCWSCGGCPRKRSEAELISIDPLASTSTVEDTGPENAAKLS